MPIKLGDKTHSVQTRTIFTKNYKGKLNSKKESHRSFNNLSPAWELKNKIQTAQVSKFVYSYLYIRNVVSKRRIWIEFQKKKILEIYGKNKVTKGIQVKKPRIYTFQLFWGDDQLMKRETVIKTNQLMMNKAKVAVCSEIRTKHSTQSEHHIEFSIVTPGGT